MPLTFGEVVNPPTSTLMACQASQTAHQAQQAVGHATDTVQQYTQSASNQAQQVANQAQYAARTAGEKVQDAYNQATGQAQYAANRAGDKMQDAYHQAQYAASRAGDKAQDAYHQAQYSANRAGDRVQDAASNAQYSAARVGDRISDTLSQAATQAQQAARQAGEKLSETLGFAQNQAEDTYQQAQYKARDAYQQASYAAHRAGEKIGETFQQPPQQHQHQHQPGGHGGQHEQLSQRYAQYVPREGIVNQVRHAPQYVADQFRHLPHSMADQLHHVQDTIQGVAHRTTHGITDTLASHTAQLAMGSILAAFVVLGAALLAARKVPQVAALARRAWPGEPLIVFYDPRSHNSMRVLLYLREAGLPFRTKRVDLYKGEHKSPDYTRLNPRGQVPFLIDGYAEIGESAGIIEYLSRMYPSSLVPWSPSGLACNSKLIAEFHQKLDPKNVFGAVNFRGESRDQLKGKVDDLFKECRVWEGYLDGKSYLTGEDIATADIVAFPFFVQMFDGLGLPRRDFPNLSAWVQRIKERPSARDLEYLDELPRMLKSGTRDFLSSSSSGGMSSSSYGAGRYQDFSSGSAGQQHETQYTTTTTTGPTSSGPTSSGPTSGQSAGMGMGQQQQHQQQQQPQQSSSSSGPSYAQIAASSGGPTHGGSYHVGGGGENKSYAQAADSGRTSGGGAAEQFSSQFSGTHGTHQTGTASSTSTGHRSGGGGANIIYS